MSSAYENEMSDQQANNYTQQYPVSRLCAHILCSNAALFGGYCSEHQSERAEAAEARAADLAESNREQAEAITTLRAERDDQATRIIELEATTAAYKIGNDELKRIIDTLRSERNEAWSSLKETRDTIQDLTP